MRVHTEGIRSDGQELEGGKGRGTERRRRLRGGEFYLAGKRRRTWQVHTAPASCGCLPAAGDSMQVVAQAITARLNAPAGLQQVHLVQE